MTITREQVADLQPGDVVEVRSPRFPGVITTGPLTNDGGVLCLGAAVIRCDDGSVGHRDWSLTVVSRAPRPLYVNHPRPEPAPGDVVRNAAGHLRICQPTPASDLGLRWWGYGISEPYRWTFASCHLFADGGPLTLLVDGSTGEVVP